MDRSNVPKFGSWEDENNVPYTVYFDKARENRGGGKTINSNDPQENPENRASREDGDVRQFGYSPAWSTSESGRGQRPIRPVRTSVRSGLSCERSPIQVRRRSMDSGSTPWERRNLDSSRFTPRLTPAPGDESPYRGASVPRFGEWDEKDPGSEYARKFGKVRKESNKNKVAGTMSGSPKHPSSYGEPKGCCFPWLKQ